MLENVLNPLLKSMIIYNETTSIEEEIHEPWLDWMKNIRIPEMLATGKFTRALLARVKSPHRETTYSVQFSSPDAQTLQRFFLEDAQDLQEAPAGFLGKMMSFGTELEVLEQSFPNSPG